MRLQVDKCRLVLAAVSFIWLLGCGPQKDIAQSVETSIETHNLPPIFLVQADNGKITEAAHDFHFKNDSNDEIILKLESSTCGCTRVKIVPERIQPGGTAVISLAYDLAYAQESRSETVLISTNQNPPQQKSYRLNVTTYPRLELIRTDHNTIICDPGADTNLLIWCRSYYPKSDANPGPLSLESSSKFLRILYSQTELPQEKQIEDAILLEHKYELELISPNPNSSDFDVNGYSAILTLHNRNDQTHSIIRWRPAQYIDADKSSIFFNLRIDTVNAEQIILTGKDKFSIKSVRTRNGLCSVSYDATRSELHQIEVLPNEKVLSNARSANNDVIAFFTDHPLQPEIRFNVNFLLPLRKASE